MPKTQMVKTEVTIVLRHNFGNYVWIRTVDDEPVSPIFRTIEAAQYFVDKIPFRTDSEWREYCSIDPSKIHKREILTLVQYSRE